MNKRIRKKQLRRTAGRRHGENGEINLDYDRLADEMVNRAALRAMSDKAGEGAPNKAGSN